MSGLLDVAGSQPLGGKVRQCPAHVDSSPSLSVRPGPDGVVFLKCFSGCTLDDILDALRCTRSRLHRPPRLTPAAYADAVRLKLELPPVVLRHGHPAANGYRLEAVHDYGPAVLERWRGPSGDKALHWETVRPNGARVPGLFGIRVDQLPLYREREIRHAVAAGEPVLIVESESSVDALRGWYATTWAGGADAVNLARLRDVLGGHPHTLMIPDNDPAGMRCLARVQAAGLAPSVLLPEEGEDARDLRARLGEAAGFTVVAIREGVYVRLMWPRDDRRSLTVPLDPTMADYLDLLSDALAELEWAAERGRCAQQALDAIR